VLAPLALTQFVASFAGSNMNVAINSIGKDLGTTVHGVQTAITLFLLCMAALMIPGSKLTDKWGRRRCLLLGLLIYGIGAIISALAPGLPTLIVGYSAFEGVGSALMIPPIYILATLYFDSVQSRARAFGTISGAAGIGSATGPLIGGLITTAISWRVSFLFQALIVALVVVLSARISDPLPADPKRPFDLTGAAVSAAGLFFVVIGILQAGNNGLLLGIFIALGLLLLAAFYLHIRRREHAHEEPLLRTSLFKNRTSNLGLVTQNVQWLFMMGITFVVSVYLQTVQHFSAIKTGLVFTAATVGLLISSAFAQRMASRREQRTLIRGGFVASLVGVGLLLALAGLTRHVWSFLPGLFVIGLGVGVMITASVNVVQSAFPEREQGEISGLSRSVSNLGSSMGTAIAGTILVADLVHGGYVAATIVLTAVAALGLVAALLLPPEPRRRRELSSPPEPATSAAHP